MNKELAEHLSEVKKKLSGANIELDDDQIDKIKLFLEDLIKVNKHTNLVSKQEDKSLIDRHVLDSLTALEFKEFSNVSDNKAVKLVDMGSGAGFPGMCLAIAKNNLRVTLVESSQKKVAFLNQIIDRLELKDRVSTCSSRLEEFARTSPHRGGFDFVTSRALGHLCLNAELGLPLLKENGVAIFYKTKKQFMEERHHLAKILESLGSKRIDIITPTIQTGSTEHILVTVRKTHKGSNTYPRSWKKIKKSVEALKA